MCERIWLRGPSGRAVGEEIGEKPSVRLRPEPGPPPPHRNASGSC